MQFTLFTKQGRILQFYVKAVAETYQQAYGGVIINTEIQQTQTQGVTA